MVNVSSRKEFAFEIGYVNLLVDIKQAYEVKGLKNNRFKTVLI